jgi:hypothetical protein
MLLKSWVKFTHWLHRCWRDPIKRLALIATMVCVACLGILAGPPYFSTASVAQRWPHDPVMEIETVTDREDLRLVLDDVPSQDRETMRVKVRIDFGFIAAYVTLLVALGVVHSRAGGWRRFAGVAVAICALAIGVFDVLENLAILDILDMPIASTGEAMLSAIREPSRFKWSLAAVCAALLLGHYEPFTRSTVSDSVRSDQS